MLLVTGNEFVQGQDLVVSAFLPPGALIEKEQLWNVIIANPLSTPRHCQLSVTILNKSNGQKMMTALSGSIVVPTGARQMQIADVMPVVYNSLSNDIDLSSPGFLPVGLYQICYEVLEGKEMASGGNTCVDVQVDVLAPPQLIFPENKSAVKETQPLFSWVPPVPLSLVRNCTYEYKIVKVGGNQVPADAIRDNVPVYASSRLANTTLPYPAFATALEKQQLYAWQITAQSSTSNLKSDIWTFTIEDENDPTVLPDEGNTYTKLAKGYDKAGYSIVQQMLKFSFFNESADSVFQITIADVTSSAGIRQVKLNKDKQPQFLRGLNLVDMGLEEQGKFIKNHMYEFTLIDKIGQEWKMLFEYKGKNRKG
ncbi:hypothetical protein [Pinibacter soli]|uniref:Uncharacterized protein n=1 Tax=Pinibacter soli TaxID=3044211 RepID=A0ABT6RG05_9BACT|nr:hypothetical protein [Pinibacter soli]MDI3321391.1 hypothetical protein [Pinibacter soli]